MVCKASRDRLQGTRRHDGKGRDIHRFREKEILDFIRRHPLEINLGRVDAVWFLDMILLKGREFPLSRPARGADVAGEADGVEPPPASQRLPRLQAQKL